MPKAKTAGAKRRTRRSRRISLPGGVSVDQRPTQGRRVDLDAGPADAVALASRAAHTGCTEDEARDVLAADDVGRCIRYMRSGAEDRRALLSVWQAVSAAWANYCARCLSVRPTAQGAALPLLSEAMQTDQSARVDLRTSEERDLAARRAWMMWDDAIFRLPFDMATGMRWAIRGDGPALWDADQHRPTFRGAVVVKALLALHRARYR